jgi:hypothetical protein
VSVLEFVVGALKVVMLVALVALLLWVALNTRVVTPPVAPAVGVTVLRWHDPDLPVSCWLYQASISCLPDRSFE